jgi:hypothetical protein
MSIVQERVAPILREAFPGRSIRLLAGEPITTSVQRVRVVLDDAERSLVVKRSDAISARRNWLVARRWLPAVGFEDRGPPLLAVVAEPGGETAWHVYEDLGDRTLAVEPAPVAVSSAVSLLAKLHTRFADRPMLAECREWGGEMGASFYRANVRDAIKCLEAVPPSGLRNRLLERMLILRAEEGRRIEAIADLGGPETLLHGDLWLKNVAVVGDGAGTYVRLIDWDKAGVGPIGYDLSTFLCRFPAGERQAVLRHYEEIVAPAGWRLPGPSDMNYVFATFESARLANCVVWAALEVTKGGEIAWALEELEMADDSLASLDPALALS